MFPSMVWTGNWVWWHWMFGRKCVWLLDRAFSKNNVIPKSDKGRNENLEENGSCDFETNKMLEYTESNLTITTVARVGCQRGHVSVTRTKLPAMRFLFIFFDFFFGPQRDGQFMAYIYAAGTSTYTHMLIAHSHSHAHTHTHTHT